jgi:hypothetical protein
MPRKAPFKNTFEFVANAKEIHGEKYDYSKSEYKNSIEKITIICPLDGHGEFKQLAYNHINLQYGCLKCGSLSAGDSRRSNKEEFIMKAKERHGDKFDYSKTEYKTSKDKVTVKCILHDFSFETHGSTHLEGDGGCIKCQVEKYIVSRTFTQEEFINRAKEIHGEKYNYDSVVYIKSQFKIVINCPTHGPFEQPANSHLQGDGCRKCASSSRGLLSRKSTLEFITESENIHGNKYDYSEVDYITCKDKVSIICRIHGIFEQNPNCHLSGKGCDKCGIERRVEAQRFTQEEFISKAKEIHGEKYNYDSVVYTNSQSYVAIICPTHGQFEQVANSHLQGYGCDKCAHLYNNECRRLTTDEIVERAKQVHGDKYDYSCTVYIGDDKKIDIRCRKCDCVFSQLPSNHIRAKHGCPLCVNKTEAKLLVYLMLIFPYILKQYRKDWCKNKSCLPFDFCIEELKIIIELDGAQHFRQILNWQDPCQTRRVDVFKMKCALENGYRVIRLLQQDVWENDEKWLDIHLKPLLTSDATFDVVYIDSNDIYQAHIRDMENTSIIIFE